MAIPCCIRDLLLIGPYFSASEPLLDPPYVVCVPSSDGSYFEFLLDSSFGSGVGRGGDCTSVTRESRLSCCSYCAACAWWKVNLLRSASLSIVS